MYNQVVLRATQVFGAKGAMINYLQDIINGRGSFSLPQIATKWRGDECIAIRNLVAQQLKPVESMRVRENYTNFLTNLDIPKIWGRGFEELRSHY